VVAQQSLPTGTGLGYRLHADNRGGSESLMFQSQYGRYEGDYANNGGDEAAQAFASGSLVLASGKLFAARPVEQGYAVVRVPGVANVRTLLNNQEIGRTDKDGDILVPNLLPYYGNRISIVPADLPIDYEIPPLEQVIATPNRGGGVVTFHAFRIVGYSGSIILREGLFRLPPTYGQLDVRTETGMQSSPLGKNGEFYLENLPPGDYPAHVHSDGGDCDLVLSIPDRPEKFIDLGVHYCHGKFNTPMTFTQAHAQAAK
jgi:outer membrane usher protein